MTTNHPIAKQIPRPKTCRTPEANRTQGTGTPREPTVAINNPETNICSLTIRTARVRKGTRGTATIRITKDLINNPILEGTSMASTKTGGTKVEVATVALSKVRGTTRTAISPTIITTTRIPISSLRLFRSNQTPKGRCRTSFLNEH